MRLALRALALLPRHRPGFDIRAFFLRSPLLRSGLRVLDAGCGTGAITLALHGALARRRLGVGRMHAFDLTLAMLQRFRMALGSCSIEGIEMMQADVLQMDALPSAWNDYDLIVSASMLEYVPRGQLPNALAGLELLRAFQAAGFSRVEFAVFR